VRTWGGRGVVAALLALSVAGALILNRATRESSVPEVGPSITESPTTTPRFSPHVVASPLASGRGETMAGPQTARAAPGIAYSVRLLAPCVVLLDFDGSFWSARPGTKVYRPIQPVTVTLLRDKTAVLHTAAGQDLDIRRIPGPVTVPACP
jgi:hypothetical protein